MMYMTITLAAVNFAAGWNTVYGAIQSAVGTPATTLMTAIGVVLVVGAIGKWLWDRRRGQTGQHSGLLWTFAIGALLSTPGVVMPILLGLSDVVINAMLSLFSSVSGK